jgi:hypothetical protein
MLIRIQFLEESANKMLESRVPRKEAGDTECNTRINAYQLTDVLIKTGKKIITTERTQ